LEFGVCFLEFARPVPRHLKIADYTYALPDDRIARYPLPERDAARMLVFSNDTITDRHFRDLPAELPPDALLVLNETRVVPARLILRRPTGGRVEVFCLEPAEPDGADVATAMVRSGGVRWRCMVGGAARWRAGEAISAPLPDGSVEAVLHAREEGGTFLLDFSWSPAQLSFAEVLAEAGAVPLPPYLNRDAEESDAERYQTVFARWEGSVAAPTASLHFTPAVLASLEARGVQKTFVTLHVGAGTFRPVKSETMEGHDMHAEWISVEAASIQKVREQIAAGRPVAAVGTTAARTLESLYWIGARLLRGEQLDPRSEAVSQWTAYELSADAISSEAALGAALEAAQAAGGKLTARTALMIAPGYDWKICDALVTNFHQPHSTLLLLVASLVGPAWRTVYSHALASGYRFLSYGDSSLLFRVKPA